MKGSHKLGGRAHCRGCAALDQKLQELDVVERALVDGVVLVVALVDLVGPLGDEVLHAVPRASLTGDVKQGSFLLPGKPVVFALLRQQLQDVDLVAIDGVVDGALELVRASAVVVDLALAALDVFPPLFTVLLMWTRPTHPRFHINSGPVLQKQLNEVLITTKAGNVERKGTAASIDVDVAGDAPADHLQVVDPRALLQQVVPLLIVDHQYVLTPRDLAQQAIKPLHSDSGVSSQGVE